MTLCVHVLPHHQIMIDGLSKMMCMYTIQTLQMYTICVVCLIVCVLHAWLYVMLSELMIYSTKVYIRVYRLILIMYMYTDYVY